MKFTNIIAAIDPDDDLAAGVVRAAASLAEKEGAQLQLVSVWPLVSAFTPAFSADAAAGAAIVSQAVLDQHKEGRADNEKQLADLGKRLAPSARTVLLDGEAADEVAKHAAATKADLIVTGSHQRGFWNSLLQGSASRELVQEAPCAVMLITKKTAEKLAAEV